MFGLDPEHGYITTQFRFKERSEQIQRQRVRRSAQPPDPATRDPTDFAGLTAQLRGVDKNHQIGFEAAQQSGAVLGGSTSRYRQGLVAVAKKRLQQANQQAASSIVPEQCIADAYHRYTGITIIHANPHEPLLKPALPRQA